MSNELFIKTLQQWKNHNNAYFSLLKLLGTNSLWELEFLHSFMVVCPLTAYNNNRIFKVAVISVNTGWHCCCSGPLQFAAVLIFTQSQTVRTHALHYIVLLFDWHISIYIFDVFMLFSNVIVIRVRLVYNTDDQIQEKTSSRSHQTLLTFGSTVNKSSTFTCGVTWVVSTWRDFQAEVKTLML